MLRRSRQIVLLTASLVGAAALYVLWSWPESYVSTKTQHESKKFLIAFGYWEQLTQATNSLLKLTALAAYTGRQVVIPFVKDSKFYGTVRVLNQTLSAYFNLDELNRKLQFSGHAKLVGWDRFRHSCQDRLDVLVSFDYYFQNVGSLNDNTAVYPCKNSVGTYERLTVSKTTCVYARALHSAKAFEKKIAKSHKCVGIIQWRGNDESRKEARAQFNLTSSVIKPLSFNDLDTNFFNVKLKFIAKGFIEQNLRPDYISIHLRAEAVLYHGRSVDFLKQCISELSERAQIVAGSLSLKVFLSTDFSKYGSDSRNGYLRNEAASIMELLTKKLIQPITFDPTDYGLTDNGAVAIVETNILTAGRRLFLLGGGSFQAWIKNMFLTKNNFDNKLVDSSCIMI